MAKTYWEKLQDPRWQKLRLEAMQAKDFCCELCGDKENSLNVHHKSYFKNHEPWEYDINQLAVLCQSCHEDVHNQVDLLKVISSYSNLDGPKNRTELAVLLYGYLEYPIENIINFLGEEPCQRFLTVYKLGVFAAKKVG